MIRFTVFCVVDDKQIVDTCKYTNHCNSNPQITSNVIPEMNDSIDSERILRVLKEEFEAVYILQDTHPISDTGTNPGQRGEKTTSNLNNTKALYDCVYKSIKARHQIVYNSMHYKI